LIRSRHRPIAAGVTRLISQPDASWASPRRARLMLRPKPLACSGVKSDAQVGTSDVTSGARGAPNDVKSGAQVQLPRLRRVQLPVQLSNLTGPARSGRYEPVLVPPMCTPEARADAMYLRLTRRLTYVASQPIRWSRSAQACGLNRRCPIRE
jgi:hypothetical protein